MGASTRPLFGSIARFRLGTIGSSDQPPQGSRVIGQFDHDWADEICGHAIGCIVNHRLATNCLLRQMLNGTAAIGHRRRSHCGNIFFLSYSSSKIILKTMLEQNEHESVGAFKEIRCWSWGNYARAQGIVAVLDDGTSWYFRPARNAEIGCHWFTSFPMTKAGTMQPLRTRSERSGPQGSELAAASGSCGQCRCARAHLWTDR
jgi:hypothetical protein